MLNNVGPHLQGSGKHRKVVTDKLLQRVETPSLVIVWERKGKLIREY